MVGKQVIRKNLPLIKIENKIESIIIIITIVAEKIGEEDFL